MQHFRLTVPPATKVDRGGSILSFPKGGLPVVLSEQDHKFPKADVKGNIHDLVDFK